MITPHVTEILPSWIVTRSGEQPASGPRTVPQRDLVAASLLVEGGRRDVYPPRAPDAARTRPAR